MQARAQPFVEVRFAGRNFAAILSDH